MSNKKAVLAFSGGLDTSVCVKYLQNNHNMEVITATVDCGQEDDFEEIRKNFEENRFSASDVHQISVVWLKRSSLGLHQSPHCNGQSG